MKKMCLFICLLSINLTVQASTLTATNQQEKTVKNCNVYTPNGQIYTYLKEKGYNVIQTAAITPVYHQGYIEHKISTKYNYQALNLQTGDLYLEFSGLVYVNIAGWIQPKTQVNLLAVGELSPNLLAISKNESSIALPWNQAFNLDKLPNCK